MNEPHDDYSDIINLSRPKSLRAPMPLRDRAAQFSPFAALTGSDASIQQATQAAIARVQEADSIHSIQRP